MPLFRHKAVRQVMELFSDLIHNSMKFISFKDVIIFSDNIPMFGLMWDNVLIEFLLLISMSYEW